MMGRLFFYYVNDSEDRYKDHRINNQSFHLHHLNSDPLPKEKET